MKQTQRKSMLNRSITWILKSKKSLGIAITITALISFSNSGHSVRKIANDYLPRELSLYLGDGKCIWQPPIYDVPENITFTKTLIAGFPSGDKRLTFVQMEALTGLSARDEWDFAFLGPTNQPFIKANYPHHEGIWGWGDRADQVIMIVRNIRRTMVEYHDILWDIGYAKTFEEAYERLDQLYAERPPRSDFYVWRDERVMDEIHWYGWFIDYYMEGGLMRDMFTHKITTPEHWYMLMQPTRYTKEEMAYDKIVGNDTYVSPSYDPHCENDVTAGCEPIQIISAERLVETDTGPAEGRKIAEVLVNRTGIKNWLIEEDAWECIWTELIVNKKGLKTFIDRDGFTEREYNFSEEMLSEMIDELNRLVVKYSGAKWTSRPTANRLVALLNEHLALIEDEYEEVAGGRRLLAEDDFLGPKTRKALYGGFIAKE
mmetsp:Transcript_3245/g.4737  ORF Transcript_3245/g.4737 Transcript_3245/m.4737 type:complete len:430 (+) Transcript_3245:188-1477(+)